MKREKLFAGIFVFQIGNGSSYAVVNRVEIIRQAKKVRKRAEKFWDYEKIEDPIASTEALVLVLNNQVN